MKFKFVVILLVILAIGTALFFYINKYFLPVRAKQILIEKAQEVLKRKVTFKDIHFNFLKGLTIHQLTIFEKGSSDTPFITIDELSAGILYAPLFRERKIIIPSLKITHPTLTFIRSDENTWNFSDLIPSPSQNPFSFYLSNFSMENGTIQWIDRSSSSLFEETIENLGIKAGLSPKKGIHYTIIASVPKKFSTLKINGDYKFASKKLSAQIWLNQIHLDEYLGRYLKIPNFEWKAGTLISANITLEAQDKNLELSGATEVQGADFTVGNKEYLGDLKTSATGLSLKNNVFKLKTDLTGGGVSVRLTPDHQLNGDVQISSLNMKWEGSTFNLESDIAVQKSDFRFKDKTTIAGNLKSEKILLSVLNEVLQLTADLNADNLQVHFGDGGKFTGAVTTPALHLRWQDQTAVLKADLDLKSALLHINGQKEIQAEVTAHESALVVQKDVVDLRSKLAFQSSSFKMGDLLLTGVSNLNLHFSYNPNQEWHWTYDGSMNGKDINLTGLPYAGEVKNIEGTVDFTNDKISSGGLKGIYQGKNYHLSGTLENFSRPVLKTTLQSDDLNFETDINILNNAFQITAFKGKYFESAFDVKGDIHILEDTTPVFNVTSRLDLQLEDAERLLPCLATGMGLIKPKGLVSLNASFRGTPKDWRNWSVLVKGTSPEITLQGYKLSDVDLTFDERDQNVNKCDVSATFYGGKLVLKSSADLTTTQSPYRTNLNLEDVNLAELREDSPLKTKDIAGTLMGFVVLHGNLNDLKNSQGNGNISITDGYLWQLNLLRGLGRLLLIPEYREIVFTEATTNLTIKNQKTRFEDLELISRPLTLKGSGWVDLEGNIDFSITSHFDMTAIEESHSIKKTVTALLTTTNSYLNIKVTGTLDNPQYRSIPSPVNVLEKTRDLIKEGIQSIF